MRALAVLVLLLGLATLGAAVEVTLSAEENAACQARGGCEFVTRHWLRSVLQEAFEAGLRHGVKQCFKGTT